VIIEVHFTEDDQGPHCQQPALSGRSKVVHYFDSDFSSALKALGELPAMELWDRYAGFPRLHGALVPGNGQVARCGNKFVACFNWGLISIPLKLTRCALVSQNFLCEVLSDQAFCPSLLAYECAGLWVITIQDGTALNRFK
jgi:hypothetical protein